MVLSRQIRLVLFDWGDTLVRPPGVTTDEGGHLACLESVFREFDATALGAELRHARIDWPVFSACYLKAAHRQIAATSETGREHTFADRFAQCMELAGFSRGLDTAERQGMATRLGQLVAAGCRPIDGAGAAVRRIAERYAVGLLSNYPHPTVVRASLEPLECAFDPFIISGECGWAKPHPKAYGSCLHGLDVTPEEVLFVGDDPVNDVEGPREFGFRTCWIERSGARPPAGESLDLKVASVSELAGILVP
jgi:HAD superfamily hydrolase (TIGR01549 family)